MPRKGEEVHEPGDIQPAAERLPATAHTWVSDGFGMFCRGISQNHRLDGWRTNGWICMDLPSFFNISALRILHAKLRMNLQSLPVTRQQYVVVPIASDGVLE